MPALLTVGEVARAFKVEPSTVYRWVRAGDLQGIRLGGTVRIPADALERLTIPIHTKEADR